MKLTQIVSGRWAAVGEGWAVFGDSREEAVQAFRRAEERHRQIEARAANAITAADRQRREGSRF